jgi:L-amino acid N-acyltransferase YncA
MLSLRPILRLGARLASVRRKLLLEAPTASTGNARSDATFRYGDAVDLYALAAPEYQYDETARRFGHERLAAGDRLVIGELAGRIVYYAWIMYGQMDMGLREYKPLRQDQAYTYKLFTVADCRGRGICPAYYNWLKRELREAGYRSVLAWVEAGNRPSLRVHDRAGFRQAGTIWHARLFFRSYPVLRAA